jgi:hypothetical protein
MSLAPTTPVNQILIMINVTLDPKGLAVYTPLFYPHGPHADDPVIVQPGDRVGWFVRVQVRLEWKTLPYQITFSDPAIFGTTSISVPNGGGSGYLPVLSLGGARAKYTLSVASVYPPFDPEIQVNPDPLENEILATGAQWVALWTVASNAVTFQKDNIPTAQLSVAKGDMVQFRAQADTAPQFYVVFPPDKNQNHTEESPFDGLKNKFVGTTQVNSQTEATDTLQAKFLAPDANPFYLDFALLDGSKQSADLKMTVSAMAVENAD